MFCKIRESRQETQCILQDGEWQVLQDLHLTSWFKVLRNGEIFAEVQVSVDFPDENTMQETVTIRRQNRTTVLRRTNPAAPAALNPAELLRLVQGGEMQ